MESKWQIYRNYPPKSSGIWIEILPMMFGAPLSSMIFVMIKRDKICWHLFRRAPSWVSRAFTIRPGSWCTWPKVQPTFFAKPTHGHWGPLQIALSFQLRCSYRQVLIELFTLVLQVERYSLNWRPGLDESMCLGFEKLKLWSGYPTGKRNWSLVKAWYFPFSKVFKLGTFPNLKLDGCENGAFEELTPGRYYDVYCFSETYVPPSATGADTVAQFGMDPDSILQTRTQLITLGPFFDDLGWSCVSGRPCNVTSL